MVFVNFFASLFGKNVHEEHHDKYTYKIAGSTSEPIDYSEVKLLHSHIDSRFMHHLDIIIGIIIILALIVLFYKCYKYKILKKKQKEEFRRIRCVETGELKDITWGN